MSKSRFYKALYVGVILVAAGMLLFAAARQKSFWEDEAFSVIFAQKEPGELIQVAEWDVHPPLYLVLANQWGRIFGYDETGMRSLSILFALLAVLLFYQYTCDLLGERAGLIGLPLLAFNPLFIMYAHNARYYSLAVLLALLVAWSTLRFKKVSYWPFLLIYVVGGTAFLYLVFSSLIVLGVCLAWWLVRWWLERPRSKASLGLWVTAQVVMVALYLPGFSLLQNATGRFAETAQLGNWVVELIKRGAYYGFVSTVGETLSPLNPLAWLGVAAATGLAIYALVKNWKALNFWMPVSFFLVIGLANLALTLNAAVSETWQNLTYRGLYAYPFLMAWLAAGMARMKVRWLAFSGGVLAVVFAAGLVNYYAGRQFIRPVYTVPWREIFERIQDDAQTGALVICGYGDSSCYYYADLYGFGQNDLNNWGNLSKQEPPEIWYIRTNRGRDDPYGDQPQLQATFLEEMADRYPVSIQVNFAPQDPSIRWLKARLMNQDDYEYRINLLHFMKP